ncbi:MAG: putative sporulation protein YtxC [Bacillota bacterium]
MKLLTTMISQCSDYMISRLDKEIKNFHKEGIVIEQSIKNDGSMTIISYDLKDESLCHYTSEDFEIIFKHYIANALSDIIIQEMEGGLIKKILRGQYYYFTPVERQEILKHLEKQMEYEELKCVEGLTYKISRKAKILQQIMEYLMFHDHIHVDGFIRFRLQNYICELEDHIEKAVEDFMMEKEYNEFIRLLKYFVDVQESKINVVNVLICSDGKYILYDHAMRIINNEYMEDIALEMADNDVSYDDLLISSLITIAPKKIIIHSTGKIWNKEIIKTIRNVFCERVNLCKGCELCLVTQSVHEE